MFKPKYTYTNKLVENTARIREIVVELNEKKFPHTVLVELEKEAKVLSAFSSTSIEGNPLPLTDVKKILKTLPENIRETEREVLNYNNALEKLNAELKNSTPIKFTHEFIFEIHKMVLENLMPKTQLGKYREQPVFVNDPRKRQTVYWPPNHEDVYILMNELIEFLDHTENKTDSIIKTGIFHKQFVLIHPFTDGNGRSVRLLTKFFLAKLGLDTFQLFSFENYYNANITKYFEKVGEINNYYDVVKKVDFTPWLEYFTDGIIDELTRVSKLLSTATTLEDRLEEHHSKIIDLIKERGVVKDSDYEKITNRSRASRVLDFQKLTKLGIIERKGKGRGSYYIMKE